MILTSEQRVAFMRWLETEVDSDAKIMKNMKTLHIAKFVIDTRKADYDAKMHVLNILRNIEL